MKKVLASLLFCLLGRPPLAVAQTPQATELPGSPFTIKKTWIIGGEGNWDYMTLDPKAFQLFIAHGTAVQVVDINTGKITGQVTGLREAHDIALDDEGQFGYISDGVANDVKIFDRSSFEVVARVPTGKNPRAVVFDAASGLIFAICPDTVPESRIPRRNSNGQIVHSGPDASLQSTVTVIDAENHKKLADILVPGRLGFAQSDGKGTVYVNVLDRNQIVYFHAGAIEARLRRQADRAAVPGTNPGANPEASPDGPNGTQSAEATSAASGSGVTKTNRTGTDAAKSGTGASDPVLTIDWGDHPQETQAVPRGLHTFNLGQNCESPKGLAIDSTDDRLFVTCDNMKMLVLNATDGSVVATLPIGAGNDAIGYDPDRRLIYASNGGGVGSLTIIRQHLTDSYAVIQELPTQARARTLVVNPETGEVYLVTNIVGLNRAHDGGIGGLQATPVAGSFQVLVVGN